MTMRPSALAEQTHVPRDLIIVRSQGPHESAATG